MHCLSVSVSVSVSRALSLALARAFSLSLSLSHTHTHTHTGVRVAEDGVAVVREQYADILDKLACQYTQVPLARYHMHAEPPVGRYLIDKLAVGRYLVDKLACRYVYMLGDRARGRERA
jgi:hypothetical protein